MQSLIDQLNTADNLLRKKISKAQIDIYLDVIEPYVKEYLAKFYSQRSIESIPIFSTINLAKRIVEQESSLYRVSPKRKFKIPIDENNELLEQFYRKINIDNALLRANRFFKLQGQTHVEVITDTKSIKLRVLPNHLVDVITDDVNQEIARYFVLTTKVNGKTLYAFFSDKENFILNEDAELVTESVENPIEICPIIEIAPPKLGEYWLRNGTALTDFTVQFNAAMTDIGNIVRMQGFAQAYLKADEKMIPQNVQIGPNLILYLPVDPKNPVDTEFGYANPNPDLQGSLQFPQNLLSAFLTSRGLSPKVISTTGESVSYSSGLDRLLAMIERFEASQEDASLFQQCENQILKVIVAMLNRYDIIPGWKFVNIEDCEVEVEYEKPKPIETEKEKLEFLIQQKEAGLISDVEAIALWHGLSIEEARIKQQEILNG